MGYPAPRRSKYKLVIFYKIINGLTTACLSDILPPIIQDNITYDLRNANNMQSLRAYTHLLVRQNMSGFQENLQLDFKLLSVLVLVVYTFALKDPSDATLASLKFSIL